MVGRGGIWGGGLDTWSSMGLAATVRKCSLRQTAHHRSSPCACCPRPGRRWCWCLWATVWSFVARIRWLQR